MKSICITSYMHSICRIGLPAKPLYLERYPGDEWVDVTGFDIYQHYEIGKNDAFAREFGRTLGELEKIAADHGKIPALTEFGYAGLPDSSWSDGDLCRHFERA